VRVYGLVVAAGLGSRFGGGKLMAKWQDRELLGHVLLKLGSARAAGLVAGTVVVHREEDEAVRALATEYRCMPVPVGTQDAELSTSLQTGLRALAGRGSGFDRQAALICLGDQPLLRLDVIAALVEAWNRSTAPIVRPSYREDPGKPGHPILIARSLWPLASELRGDTGFNTLFEIRRMAIRTVSVAGTNPDVDTLDDLRALDATLQPAPERSGA
jgi:molybdenum cofactor cytidylyltransferase